MEKSIVIITNSLSFGGAERISVVLAKWLSDKGYEAHLITLKKDNEKKYELPKGVNRISLDMTSDGLNNIKLILKLRKALKRVKPTLILVMGVPLSLYAMPATFGLNIPVIISERNDPTNFKGKEITKKISRKLMNSANGFVFQTNEAKSYYSKAIQGRATVIPNPLLADNLPSSCSENRKNEIVTVGRLVSQKNHELLIKSFKNVSELFPEYKLNIYGTGTEEAKLQDLITSLNLNEHVFLKGTTEKIFEEIIDSRLFVLSSDFEGMPNALIEALALGIPSISTDCPSGGPRSLINHQENGLLVETNNEKQLTDAIIWMLNNSNEAEQMGRKGLEIRKKLDVDVVCLQWMNFIEKFSIK